jgi:hypothetical protein
MNTTELQSELNETLRKIGRNVLRFQRMEAVLKYLVSHSKFEASNTKDLKEKHKKKVDTVSQKTMGILVKDLFTSVILDKTNETSTPKELDEAFFSITITMDADPAFREERKLALEHIVTERNALIHQTLLSFDPTSIESCRTLNVVLDEQDERIRSEFENIREIAKTFRELTIEASKQGFNKA